MSGSFLDTSALAKHYHVEAGSAEVERHWWRAAGRPRAGMIVSRQLSSREYGVRRKRMF